MDKLTAALGAILALGGGLGLTGIVVAVRQWKRGEIEDDDSIIKRLNADSKSQRSRANAAEVERDEEARQKNLYKEQAIRYRLQIIALGGEPKDMEVLKEELTP